LPAPGALLPLLTPHGHLALEAAGEHPLPGAVGQRLEAAFARGPGWGLLQLGASEVDALLPRDLGYWRSFAGRFVTAVCAQAGAEAPLPAPPPLEELDQLVAGVPPMRGAEYLTAAVLAALWTELAAAFTAARTESGLELPEFLKHLHPAWNVVGRVHFNLAENRKDDVDPFAFLATYTTHLGAHGKAQHLPLGQALREYAGPANKQRLVSLLLPLHRAAETCAWLKELVDSGEVFHPLRFSTNDAVQMLGDAGKLERAGVIVRMPAAWRGGRPARPRVSATVGGKVPSNLGGDALLDFRMEVTLEGERLGEDELRALLARSEGLAFVRGRWVEIDREALQQTLDRFRAVERAVVETGLSFAEAMRLVAGADLTADPASAAVDAAWSAVSAGPWLAETLRGLRSPEGLAHVHPGAALRGELRPYQEVGVRWLYLLAKLGLGACLADDMGLGKTIQVLSLLLVRKREAGQAQRPSLLVAPASLLANWAAELERFAPDLRVLLAHPSARPAAALKELPEAEIAAADLVITSYGSVMRLPWLASTAWDVAVLDEAQAIKNPGARQTRAVKQLRAHARFALTGTPIENRLGDLWSIFDFINPGLLGSAKAFSAYTRRLTGQKDKRQRDADDGDGAANDNAATPAANVYAPLRELIRPYILRRLKTDRTIITDLPEKTELAAYCALSREQAALYQQAVQEFRRELVQMEKEKAERQERAASSNDNAAGKTPKSDADAMARRGLVLRFLTRFKQICNHPSHWLGDGAWAADGSGKFARLRELCEVIAAKQEKVLVFTQFREMTRPLAAFLGDVFGRPGLVLSGDTEVVRRKHLVDEFQNDEAVPFFVLSLRAGGTGLNLTAASHVIHFDRWWNPAVENQATDRAFRLGQRKNVLVHKFICRGTVEEKIDELIASKRQLSHELLAGGEELQLTELDDDELLRLVALDLHTARQEG
jgi:non-specific serine/threonine protein kinase